MLYANSSIEARLRQVQLIRRLRHWLGFPESVGSKERLNVLQLCNFVPYVLSLVFLHVGNNFLEYVLEEDSWISQGCGESLTKLVSIIGGHLDLFEVDLEQLLQIALVWVNGQVIP